MAAYRRVDDLRSPAGWLPVHRDQLRAQRSVWSMGSLYLYLSFSTVLWHCWLTGWQEGHPACKENIFTISQFCFWDTHYGATLFGQLIRLQYAFALFWVDFCNDICMSLRYFSLFWWLSPFVLFCNLVMVHLIVLVKKLELWSLRGKLYILSVWLLNSHQFDIITNTISRGYWTRDVIFLLFLIRNFYFWYFICCQQEHAGIKIFWQNPSFLNWGCRLTQVDIYYCRKTIIFSGYSGKLEVGECYNQAWALAA